MLGVTTHLGFPTPFPYLVKGYQLISPQTDPPTQAKGPSGERSPPRPALGVRGHPHHAELG